MKNLRYLTIACSVGAAAAIAFAVSTAPSITSAQAPPPMNTAQIKALYTEKCSACHNLTGVHDPLVNGYSAQEWRRTVNRMMRKQDSNISVTDATYIANYLASIAPKRGKRGPADPWGTDDLDVWTVAPTSTRVFNFEKGNSTTSLIPEEAGAKGPAAAWHTVAGEGPDGTIMKVTPVKPSPGRFSMLLDKQDTGRNLDVKVRFQIKAGTVSPAVGIVFGQSDSKHYDLLRFDAQHKTLSLLKIDEPTHTVLQTTPFDQPSPAAPPNAVAPAKTAAAVNPTGPGWHSLRLLVNNGQIRGWIDMNKRVNISDPSYTGGKVGLWTQGDTVAVFDDWTVDIYDSAPIAPAK